MSMMNGQEIAAIRKWEEYKRMKYNNYLDIIWRLKLETNHKITFEEQCVIYTIYINGIEQGRKFHEEQQDG